MERIKWIKQLFLALLAVLIIGCDNEKQETTTEIYREYSRVNNGVFFSVPPSIATVLLEENHKGTQELKDVLEDVNTLSFLIISNSTSIKENSHFFSINNKLQDISFVDLALVNNGNEIVKLMVRHENDEVREMVVLVSNYDAFFCINFKGVMEISKIANLAQPENLAAISNLEKLNR